jgi:hypothetical protein
MANQWEFTESISRHLRLDGLQYLRLRPTALALLTGLQLKQIGEFQ